MSTIHMETPLMTRPRWTRTALLILRALDPTLTFSRKRLQRWVDDRDEPKPPSLPDGLWVVFDEITPLPSALAADVVVSAALSSLGAWNRPIVRASQRWEEAHEFAAITAEVWGLTREQLSAIISSEETRAQQSPHPFSWTRVHQAIREMSPR